MRAFLPPVVLPPRTLLLAAVVLAACSQALWAQAADPPTRSGWETLLGNGSVGGMISSGFQQGEAAGGLALQVLRGAAADSLPVIRKGTNRPSSLYVRYRGVLWPFCWLSPGGTSSASSG